MKPLKGIDDALYENLESFARQSHPYFELILGAQDPDDPALEIAHAFRRAHPELRILVVSGAPDLGENPKVSNLAHLVKFARHELILISDSNVRVRSTYLEVAARMMTPGIGLVTHMVAGTREQSLGALLENLHLNSFVSAAVSTGALIGHPCVVGKSMLMRKTDLAKLGGFHRVKDVLAEDYFLGQAFHRAGLGVAICPEPIETVNVTWSLRRFLERHLRWAQMRRRTAPFAYVAEPLLYPMPMLLALLFEERDFVLLALALALVKMLSDAILWRTIRGDRLSIVDLAWIPAKDVLLVVLWIIGFFKRSVEWRGNSLYLGSEGTLMPRNARVRPLDAAKPVMRITSHVARVS